MRVKTSVRDTVIVVIFNSKSQLHGGVAGPGRKNNSRPKRQQQRRQPQLQTQPQSSSGVQGNYSLRIIPYLQGPIVDFLRARNESDMASTTVSTGTTTRPSTFLKLKRNNGKAKNTTTTTNSKTTTTVRRFNENDHRPIPPSKYFVGQNVYCLWGKKKSGRQKSYAATIKAIHPKSSSVDLEWVTTKQETRNVRQALFTVKCQTYHERTVNPSNTTSDLTCCDCWGLASIPTNDQSKE